MSRRLRKSEGPLGRYVTCGLGSAWMKTSKIRYVGDARVRKLLREYGCPTPFHAVRMRFLGNIATPRLDASPLQVIDKLWGGELPEFEDVAGANELFQALMSFWNHLAKHQSRSKPFRLVHEPLEPRRDDLLVLCQTRTEELEGFFDGLFGDEEMVDLPERAVEGMEHLGKINAMVHGVVRLLEDPDQSGTDQELADTFRNVKEISRIAEDELHAVVLTCVEARREGLRQTGVQRRTVH